MTNSNWKCKFCESTDQPYPRAAICTSVDCFTLYRAEDKERKRQWREKYKKTPAYDAQKERQRLHRISTDYAADKKYARTEKARLLKKARRDSQRSLCTWDPSVGCILTGKHIGKSFKDAKDFIECDHFLSIAKLREVGLLQESTSAINLVWVDTSANRAKRDSLPHEFIKLQGASIDDVREMRVRVFVVLRALLELGEVSLEKRQSIYSKFDVSDLGACLDGA